MSTADLAGRRLSVAMTTDLAARLAGHLDRRDGNEDLVFVLWNPAHGATRTTAVLTDALWPEPGERLVHGDASFTAGYFTRAAHQAADRGSGLALIHSHPGGQGWQLLSRDDFAAEAGHAAQAATITGLPLLGLTRATGDDGYSARFWQRTGPRRYEPRWCENIRMIGERIRILWNPDIRPAPTARDTQARTVSAWGERAQADLARLHIGVIGAGSVGALVAESLARIGIARITLMDFDIVKPHNLDRLLHACARDARLGRRKIDVLARALRRSATAAHPEIKAFDLSVVEPEGMARAVDCDVLFSCVDRPWPRAVMNLAAYAHLVPVIDGGISVRSRGGRRLIGAEWRAHLAAPGRICLECLGQYTPGLVGLERTGMLENPAYIAGLPEDDPLRRNENVFPFSAAAAAAEVLQLLVAVLTPGGSGDLGGQLYHFATGSAERETGDCLPGCPYSSMLLTAGDTHGLEVTGVHGLAGETRQGCSDSSSKLHIRLARKLSDMFAEHL